MQETQTSLLSNQGSFQFAVDLSHLKRHFFPGCDISVMAHTIGADVTHFCVCVTEPNKAPVYWDARGGFPTREVMLGTPNLEGISWNQWDARTRAWEEQAQAHMPALLPPTAPDTQNTPSWQRAQQLSAVSNTPVSPDTSAWEKHLHFTEMVQRIISEMRPKKLSMSM